MVVEFERHQIGAVPVFFDVDEDGVSNVYFLTSYQHKIPASLNFSCRCIYFSKIMTTLVVAVKTVLVVTEIRPACAASRHLFASPRRPSPKPIAYPITVAANDRRITITLHFL